MPGFRFQVSASRIRRLTVVDGSRWQSIILAVAVLAAGVAGIASAASFDEQHEAVSVSPATQPESAIMSLLEAGLKEGRSALAIAEAEKWLRQNQPENHMLLYTAGRAAELSGDWKGAVALYQQYLERADLTSETADEAVYAVYTLLIERLDDTAAAYSFSRTAGDRLLVCPRAKQFDKWFLDKAVHRNRLIAVAKRLKACIDAGLPNDLLVARYDNYFRWLLRQLETSNGYCRDSLQVTPELLEACKGLAAAITFSEELKLQLEWAVSVRFYVQQRVAEKEVDPPIAEAKALLAKYPHYAEWVQMGWAGGTRDNHRNHVGDYKHYWEQEIHAKFAPITEAAAKLGPTQRAELMESWQPGYYNRQSETHGGLHGIKPISDYLKNNAKIANSRTGVLPLDNPWYKLSPEEALELAPKVKNSATPEASGIRAIAAGITKNEVKDGEETKIEYGRNYDKMMGALLSSEVWRLNSHWLGGRAADRLWHYCGRPGGNKKRDAMIAKSKKLAAQVKKPDVKPDAPEAKRLAQFRKLWKDYRSPQPKVPAVYERLKRVLMFTPEATIELLNDSSPEAQSLARHAIANGTSRPTEEWKALERTVSVNTDSYGPGSSYLINRHRGMDSIKDRYPEKCKPHPLEDELRKHIAARVKQNKLASWKLIAWINMQWPEDNAEQIKLMEALFKSPVWENLSFEARFSAREWFKKHVMTPGQIAWIDAADPDLACKDLIELPEDADVETTAAALSKAIGGVKKSPVKIHLQGLDKLAAVEDAVFTDPKVFDLALEVTDNLRATVRADAFGERLLALAKKNLDPGMMHRTAYYLWQPGRSDPRNHFGSSAQFVESLVDESPATALAMARMGQHIFRGRRAYGFSWQPAVARLKAIAGKAAMKIGLVTIPVARTHPAYPVYQSQADWLIGNEKTAWDKLDESWDQMIAIHRGLSIDYLMWTLQRVINQRDETRQEPLVKALLAWAKEENTPLTPTEKAEIEIAYGDIAVQRGRLEDAHTLYSRVEENKAYADLLVQHRATLRKVRAERLAKNYDAALKTLKQLEMKRVPEMWAPLRYARAEVYYDMEEYEDANDQIEKILARRPNHAEAKILQGKVQLKREKLMEATEIEVGTVSSQKNLVPGEKLKVTLSDPTLAVSGAGVEVEVAVWTTAGDKERFFLRQFGDQKTKFRGTVETALGKPNPDDRTLQVIGDDEIYYGFSDRFRKRLNDIPQQRGGPVTVASDAELMASARKLLSPAEQRLADMKKMLDIMDKRKADIDALDSEERAALKAEAEAANRRRLLQARVKPGSPIHVRVVDADRSRTTGIDELPISIESSSGDSIGRIVLKETGPYTGWFTGDVPTDRAQAMAFARNSEPGRNPNMVISPRDNYPAWRPVQEQGEKPEFTVDLNDNVPLGKMKIVAKEPGAKLKKFVVQTGMNPRNMTAVAVQHDKAGQITIEKPWHPSVKVMNDTDHHHVRNERSVYDLREIEEHIERGWMTQRYPQGVAANVVGPTDAMDPEIPAKVKWQRRYRHHNAHVIYRFRGYFYEAREITRKFKVELGKWKPPKVHGSVADPAQYMLAVDGRRISPKKDNPPKAGGAVGLEGEINLQPGVHRLEIWAAGWDCRIGFGRDVKLFANLDDPEKMTDCPNAFFNPETFPKGILAHRNGPAQVSSNGADTEFTVEFAPDSRARLLKIIFIDQESPVPTLNKLTLTKPNGEKVLPVPQDYAELNKNDTLEILTGDKVTLHYIDDRFVSKNKKTHERFLNVAYTNGRVEFADIEPRPTEDPDQEYKPYHEKLLRFEYGKPLPLVVHDADMDMSPAADSVKVTVANESGDKRELVAGEMTEKIEVGGTFRVFITPVPKTKQTIEKNEIPVAEGGTLTMTYRDTENTSPGVPTDRYARIEHAAYQKPVMKLAHARVMRFEPEPHEGWPTRGLIRGFTPVNVRRARQDQVRARGEKTPVSFGAGRTRVRWKIQNELLRADNPPEDGFKVVHGRHLHLELVAPHLALRQRSTIKVYAQTEAGRKLALEKAADGEGQTQKQNKGFDLSVPGTRALEGNLVSQKLRRSHWTGDTPEIATYLTRNEWNRSGDDQNQRFKLSVPLVADILPDYGILTPEEIERRRDRGTLHRVHGLVVQPDARIHIGFRYRDEKGEEKWLTASAKVITHPVLDVMGEAYRTAKETAYVGENLYMRVVDLGADQTDNNDTVKVRMKAKSGAEYKVTLSETDPHSGIFRGVYVLTYAKGNKRGKDYNVKMQGFPVTYGDKVDVSYTDRNGIETATHSVEISPGADGTIAAFTKKYEDRNIAMRTQFALAEGYLEVAKHHRKLGEPKAAALEYARAKQLLSKAMNEFRDPETRAHAEYLLGNLTLEEADATEKKDLQEQRYRAALSRFMDVTGTYSETLHAAKAQFKIATVYEKLGEPDIAARDYVKLAYKYPDSENLAVAMARLGSHFQRKAAGYEKKAKPLLAKTEDKDAQYDGKALQAMANQHYVKAANIFARLQERFPNHELAGKGGLLAGQAFMRGGELNEAVDAFLRVVNEENYDGVKLRSPAMYWAARCYQKLGQAMPSYSMYKRLTYDFPESKWAAYARGQLSQERMLRLETKLEIERLEEGR